MTSETGRVDSLVLKVAELCNLNCSYCYMYAHEDQSYKLRPKTMSDETYEAMLRRVAEYCDRRTAHKIHLSFHGGEPTLLGPERVGLLATRARDMLGDRLSGISMQTNGILIDDTWIAMLRETGVRVGVSIDGPAAVHDAFRVDHAGRGSHAATVRGFNKLQEAGLKPAVLCVIVPGTSGLENFRYFRSLQIKRMNFLLPDVSHDNKDRLFGRYGRTPVADYLLPIFDEWFDHDDSSVRITVFWQLIGMLLGGTPTGDAFGNPLVSYLIVESDGSIQALDALKVCQENIANSNLNVFEHGFDDLHLGLPLLHQMVHVGLPLAPKCQVCPEKALCGGGYFPHRFAKANGFDNPSVWCEDILKILAHIRARVQDHLPEGPGNE